MDGRMTRLEKLQKATLDSALGCVNCGRLVAQYMVRAVSKWAVAAVAGGQGVREGGFWRQETSSWSDDGDG